MSAPDPDAPAAGSHPRHGVPPPLYFATAFGLGAGLQRLAPLPEIDGAWRSPLAWSLLGLGLALGLWALATMLRRRTSPVPFHAARVLVIEGPYRISRNPMYVALSLVHAALALAWRQPWSLLLLPAAQVALDRTVIRWEERHLVERFGAGFEAYRARVRRWL